MRQPISQRKFKIVWHAACYPEHFLCQDHKNFFRPTGVGGPPTPKAKKKTVSRITVNLS